VPGFKRLKSSSEPTGASHEPHSVAYILSHAVQAIHNSFRLLGVFGNLPLEKYRIIEERIRRNNRRKNSLLSRPFNSLTSNPATRARSYKQNLKTSNVLRGHGVWNACVLIVRDIADTDYFVWPSAGFKRCWGLSINLWGDCASFSPSLSCMTVMARHHSLKSAKSS
jgi:hypothetical protein